jgi:hypothetical protein
MPSETPKKNPESTFARTPSFLRQLRPEYKVSCRPPLKKYSPCGETQEI